VIDLGRSCARHRPLLIDFVDRGEIRPGTSAALAHLDGCSRCIDVIESTMLTITALRRLGDEVAAIEPRADAWPRLRARLSSWRFDRVASSMPLARVVLTVSLAALLVVPIRLTDKPWGQETLDSNDSWTTSAPVSEPSSSPTAVVYSASARRTTDASNPRDTTPRTGIQPRITYPDAGSRPVQKEVPTAPSPGRRTEVR
jgi:hypothetical protein